MEYSNGMGIELPQWVITTKSGKKFLDTKTNIFIKELTNDCLFDSLAAAKTKLKDLDFGYVVKTARKYVDADNTRIRLSE